MLVYPNKYDIVCVNLTIYIFSIGLQLSFSAMLFLDQIISMKYHNEGILNVAYIVGIANISNVLAEGMASYITDGFSFSSIFEELQLQIHDPGQYMVIGLKLYKKVKKKIILVFLNIIIYFLPFCYYAILFTKIYPGTVYVWLLSPLVGRISALLMSLLHSSFISLLRFIALSFQFKQLYAISYALNIQDDEDDWMFSI